MAKPNQTEAEMENQKLVEVETWFAVLGVKETDEKKKLQMKRALGQLQYARMLVKTLTIPQEAK